VDFQADNYFIFHAVTPCLYISLSLFPSSCLGTPIPAKLQLRQLIISLEYIPLGRTIIKTHFAALRDQKVAVRRDGPFPALTLNWNTLQTEKEIKAEMGHHNS
jgi:hypothetical protein